MSRNELVYIGTSSVETKYISRGCAPLEASTSIRVICYADGALFVILQVIVFVQINDTFLQSVH